MEGKWYEKKEGTKRNQLFILSGKTLLENQTKIAERTVAGYKFQTVHLNTIFTNLLR